MATEKYTIDEVCDRGEQIYEEQIKHLVEPDHNGKFIVIDIESEDYEIAENMLIAEDRLKGRRPEAVGFGARVGHNSAYDMGWGGAKIDD